MATLVEATVPAQIATVRELFAEYARAVDEPCCFAGFEQELAELPGPYLLLMLAMDAGAAAGCVGVRRLDARSAEMKRLYVRPAYRSRGIGLALAEAAIAAARRGGYRRLMLDSLPQMREAQALYRQLEFREVPPYLPAPTPGAICFELRF